MQLQIQLNKIVQYQIALLLCAKGWFYNKYKTFLSSQSFSRLEEEMVPWVTIPGRKAKRFLSLQYLDARYFGMIYTNLSIFQEIQKTYQGNIYIEQNQ